MAEAPTGVVVDEDQEISTQYKCPDFKGYEKMAETSKDYEGSCLKTVKKWVVLEKIHGSNFSTTVWRKKDGSIGVKLGRRTAYLRAEEKFFKIETQLEFQAHLRQCSIKAWENVNKIYDEIEAITIFGELFGGFYPHPSVAKLPGISPIQKEVVYCPDIKFCAFDIALFKHNGGEREYMDYDQVMMVLSEAGFMYSKPLAVCSSFEEATSYKLGFVTPLPEQFGLPPVEDNLAEGVVIKPMKDMTVDSKKGKKRVIFKRKIDKFSERKPRGPPIDKKETKKLKSEPAVIQEKELLKYEMYALVTEQRLVNAISKIGLPYESDDPKWSDIKENMESDIKEVLQEENTELWARCSQVVKDMIVQEMADMCTEMISNYQQKNNIP